MHVCICTEGGFYGIFSRRGSSKVASLPPLLYIHTCTYQGVPAMTDPPGEAAPKVASLLPLPLGVEGPVPCDAWAVATESMCVRASVFKYPLVA
jgi:hypothetical protein